MTLGQQMFGYCAKGEVDFPLWRFAMAGNVEANAVWVIPATMPEPFRKPQVEDAIRTHDAGKDSLMRPNHLAWIASAGPSKYQSNHHLGNSDGLLEAHWGKRIHEWADNSHQ